MVRVIVIMISVFEMVCRMLLFESVLRGFVWFMLLMKKLVWKRV